LRELTKTRSRRRKTELWHSIHHTVHTNMAFMYVSHVASETKFSPMP